MQQRTLGMMGIALALCCVSAPGTALDVYIDFTGDALADTSHVVDVGAVFTGSVYADVDATNGGLDGFGVAIGFDEPPLRVNGVPSQNANIEIDPMWGFLATKGVGVGSANAGGNQDLIGGSPQIGVGVHLFDITFEAIALGTTMLDWGVQIDAPGFANFVGFDGTNLDGSLNFIDAEVRVVPIPAALPLLAGALLAGGAFGARGRKSVSR